MTSEDPRTWIIICSVTASAAVQALGDGGLDQLDLGKISDEEATKIVKFFQKTEHDAKKLMNDVLGLPYNDEGGGYE